MECDGLCVELDTGEMAEGKRVAIYNANDNPLIKRLELSLGEAAYLAETIMDLIRSESCT